MKRFLLITMLASLGTALSAAEYTTAEVSRYTRTYQQPPQFEHVVGGGEVYVHEKPEPGISIEDLLAGLGGDQPQEKADPDRRVWERYCNNEVLTKEEYLIIDAGNIPDDLKERCTRKGKPGSKPVALHAPAGVSSASH